MVLCNSLDSARLRSSMFDDQLHSQLYQLSVYTLHVEVFKLFRLITGLWPPSLLGTREMVDRKPCPLGVVSSIACFSSIL